MNNKAFTLIELLVTIVILGLITFMGFPSLQKMMSSNKIKEFEYYGESMISAAKLYMQKEGRDLKENSETLTQLENGYIVPLKNGTTGLVDLGYLEEYKPSKKGLRCDDSGSGVRITKSKYNTYTYTFQLTCHDSQKIYTKTYNDTKFKATN